VIADIRSADRLRAVFAQYRPEIVFHAAAHKHVPLMETNLEDAITNNVLGTQRLVEASVAAGVTHFVLISTDTAVNPTSVMGATKRVAELIVQSAARETGRCFVAVRFGNVLGSRGSVVPLFRSKSWPVDQ
jgi:FlaA1/EpsC-like NDP-sugar epimerase